MCSMGRQRLARRGGLTHAVRGRGLPRLGLMGNQHASFVHRRLRQEHRARDSGRAREQDRSRVEQPARAICRARPGRTSDRQCARGGLGAPPTTMYAMPGGAVPGRHNTPTSNSTGATSRPSIPSWTTDYFEYGTSTNNLADSGCGVEMGDAVLGMVTNSLPAHPAGSWSATPATPASPATCPPHPTSRPCGLSGTTRPTATGPPSPPPSPAGPSSPATPPNQV